MRTEHAIVYSRRSRLKTNYYVVSENENFAQNPLIPSTLESTEYKLRFMLSKAKCFQVYSFFALYNEMALNDADKTQKKTFVLI